MEYDLKELLVRLLQNQQDIEEVYIFGSRAYGTGSIRSDCDLLVRIPQTKNVKSSELREFAIKNCAALDFFICPDSRAVSCSNDSFVYAATFGELTEKLDAVLLWSKRAGFGDFAFSNSGSWIFTVTENMDFVMTVLPDGHVTELAWHKKIKKVEMEGLPAMPFIGDTLPKAVSTIAQVARKMVFKPGSLGPRGQAKSGWTVNLTSEYDCQNLFFTVVKPWLPKLAKEEAEIFFDGQAKISDFSLFDGKLIIEMKFIENLQKKAEVVKTLKGLSDFYRRNANVGYLLLIIFVKETVELDAMQWEAEFSISHVKPNVETIVIKVP
ncbi:nucleotidyltransferase domain-containing protein [Rhizobium leguminosarum]|uniref:PD-(D/E)XK nuclease domain-containing protein n=1 Tax=Rhizobium leguminosarum TaxID=384 RepID=UPI001441B55B|nr:nucleotidyltransferase domain-containing protein [Rhizobium leguminosarum]NKK82039.1 hypothetical protein [Rhizobium leguminosarum bv. viciae]